LSSPRDQQGATPLHVAAVHGHLKATAILIEHEADTSARDYFGQTAMEVAVKNKRHALVKLLENAA